MNVKQVVIATTAAVVLAAPAFGADERRSPGSKPHSGMTGMGSQEMDSQTVRQIQQALQDKGQNVGEIDGIMGPRTQAALRQYQQSQGMQATGRVDRQTISSLGLSRAAPGSGSSTRPGG
jgi:peptidoglycan hydrolase-like protein with peptidoglycan-binding domain